MYTRFKKEGIYDPEKFDWSSAESFFEQRKDSGVDSFDSSAWRGWSDELDSVSFCAIVFRETFYIPLTQCFDLARSRFL